MFKFELQITSINLASTIQIVKYVVACFLLPAQYDEPNQSIFYKIKLCAMCTPKHLKNLIHFPAETRQSKGISNWQQLLFNLILRPNSCTQ